jgi:hypothetical protein
MGHLHAFALMGRVVRAAVRYTIHCQRELPTTDVTVVSRCFADFHSYRLFVVEDT